MHHSVDEVVRCIKVMKLENNDITDNIQFLQQTIEELKLEEKKGGCKKCKTRTNKKPKHQIKKTAKKVKNSKYKYSK
jgi:hypothetical protein